MKKLIYLSQVLLFSFSTVVADDDMWESKGPHIRIKRNDQDGSYVEFERKPKDKMLVKTTRNRNKKIIAQAFYLRNDAGFLTSGRIKDGQGNLIWRVRYGYDKNSGLLIAEDMYRAQVKQYYPPITHDEEGNLLKEPIRKEMPIRRVYYSYDAEGNQSKAISLVPKPGKSAQEVFKRNRKILDLYQTEDDFDPNQSTSPLKDNPFLEEEKLKKEKFKK